MERRARSKLQRSRSTKRQCLSRTTNRNRKFDLLIVSQVTQPVGFRPTDEQLFVRNAYGETLPNADFLKQHFFHEGRLTEAQALYILQQATSLLTQEPNLVNVESPVTSESALGPSHKWACELNDPSMWGYPWTIRALSKFLFCLPALRFWGGDSMI